MNDLQKFSAAFVLLFISGLEAQAGVQFDPPVSTTIDLSMVMTSPGPTVALSSAAVCKNSQGTQDLVFMASGSPTVPGGIPLAFAVGMRTSPSGSVSLESASPIDRGYFPFSKLGSSDDQCSNLYAATGPGNSAIRMARQGSSLEFSFDPFGGRSSVRTNPYASMYPNLCPGMGFNTPYPYADHVLVDDLDGSGEKNDVITDVGGGFMVSDDFIPLSGSSTSGDAVYDPCMRNGPMAMADFNHDGNKDLVLGSMIYYENRNVRVFLGNGDHSFQHPSIYQTTFFPVLSNQLIPADLNGDGHIDLLTDRFSAIANEYKMVALLGNGIGGFLEQDVAMNQGPQSTVDHYALQDVDGDSKPDMVVVEYEYDTGLKRIRIFRGLQDAGLFSTVSTDMVLSSVISGLRFADVNGDGKKDLMTLEYQNDPIAMENDVVIKVRINRSSPPSSGGKKSGKKTEQG